MRGLDFDNYVSHLSADGIADSLEAWLVCVATNTLLNIVMEDIVWSSSASGLDFQYYMLVLTSFRTAVPYLLEEQNIQDNILRQLEPEFQITSHDTTQRLQGGHPVAALAESDSRETNSSKEPRHASDMDTDVDFQFSSKVNDPKLPACSGVAKARVCPVCSVKIFWV